MGGPHGSKPAPPDRRPYRRQCESGHEVDAYVPDGDRTYRQTFRQVGWIGQSGAFYAVGESPADHEPGSFSPLYFVAHSDQVEMPDAETTANTTE